MRKIAAKKLRIVKICVQCVLVFYCRPIPVCWVPN